MTNTNSQHDETVTRYSTQEIQTAFENVLLMARDNARQYKNKYLYDADDAIMERSIMIIEHVKHMLTDQD